MIKQLSIFVENKVGSLAKVTTALKDQQINLRAISSFDTPDFTIMRIVVDKPDLAKEVLINQGFAVKVSYAVAVELEDKPGELDRMLQVLAKANQDISYIYSFVLRGGMAPLIVFNTQDSSSTECILRENGFLVTGQEDLR